MNIGNAFSYITADPDWLKKVGIGTIVGFIGSLVLGIGSVILLGYQIGIVRAKLRGQQPELLEWDNWGGFIKDGLFAILIVLGYAAPIIVLVICMQVLSFGIVAAGGALENPDVAGMLGLVSGLISLCFGLLIFVYALVFSLLLPAALARFADTESIGGAFAFGEVFALVRSNFVGWIIAGWLFGFITSILTSVGSIACGIGAFAGMTFGYMAQGDAIAQAYSAAGGMQGNGGGNSAPPAAPSGGYDPNATMVDR